jgi:Tol biopolymer transport system component
MSETKMKKNHFIYLAAFLILTSLACLSSLSCKKREVLAPPPAPTPVPAAPAGMMVFIQRGHLATMDLVTNEITPLTSGTSTEWFPACSPKGNEAVYWSNAEGGVYQLWKIDLGGSHHREQLTFDETNSLKTNDQNLLINDSPSWSADGGKIVYTIEGDIWMMDEDGYNPETLLTGRSAICPALSPDGKNVLFLSSASDSVYNLWSLNISDKSVTKLTSYTDWNVGSPSYSSDGRKILFNLYRANMTQIYTVDSDGTNPVNFTTNTHSLCPRFAQNDKKIIYSSSTGEDDTLNINIADQSGANVKTLTSDGGTSPSWVPGIQAAVALPTPIGK